MIPNNERQKGQGWSRWNPLRLLVPKAWFDGRGDGGNSVAGNRSSGSQTIFTRSSITTLYGQEYPLSTELTDFLKINSSNDGRTPEIPGETIITALQDIAGDDERRWEARKLGGDSSAELASLLQCVCSPCPLVRNTIRLLSVRSNVVPRRDTEELHISRGSRCDSEASPGYLCRVGAISSSVQNRRR